MGPVRGFKKRKKETEGNASVSGYASGSPEKEGSGDWWHDFSRKMNGLISPSKGLDKFESIFKISRNTFNYICSLVEEDMMAKHVNYSFINGRPLSLYDLVAVALRRLSSGDSLVTIGESFGLNHSTVSQVTWRFVESMEEKGLQHLQWPSTETELSKIKSKFERIRGFPNCCGVIDTTHITMCLPSGDAQSKLWLDQEKNYSMLLQAVVDPEMRFLDIVTGWPGKMDDRLVFQSSNLHELCETGKRLNGKALELHEGSQIREYIIGDSGYPLLPYLVTPYEGQELSESKAEFNKRHLATRVVAQRALARLKEVWKIIQGQMWRPDKHRLPRIILVCCLLHNIVIDMEDQADDDISLYQYHDSGYQQQICGAVNGDAELGRAKSTGLGVTCKKQALKITGNLEYDSEVKSHYWLGERQAGPRDSDFVLNKTWSNLLEVNFQHLSK